MKIKMLKIARNIFGTITIIHILAMAVWLMTPREQIIKIAEKSFYPTFIHAYAVKYKQAKDVYIKIEKEYNNNVCSVGEWVDAEVNFKVKEHDLVCYSLSNTFIMTIIFLVLWIICLAKLDNLPSENEKNIKEIKYKPIKPKKNK